MASYAEIKERVKKYGVTGAGHASDPYSTNNSTNESKKDEEESGYVGSERYQKIKEKVKNGGISIDIDEDYVNSFINDGQSFLSSSQEEYNNLGWGNAASAYEAKVGAISDLNQRASKIRVWMNTNKNRLDTDAYNSLSEMLDSFDKGTSVIFNGFMDRKNYFSKWKSEEEYKKAIAEAEKAEADRKALLDYDQTAGSEAIEELEATYDEAMKIVNAINDRANLVLYGQQRAGNLQANMDDIMATDPVIAQLKEQLAPYGDVDALGKDLQEKKRYHTLAGRAQKGVELASVAGNEDFLENSKYVSTEFKPETFWDRFHQTEYDLGYDDLTHQYINGDATFRAEVRGKYDTYSRDNVYSDGESRFEEANLDQMNAGEIKIYNYYYNTEGKEKAEEYLDSIQETLNYRKAQKTFGGLEDKTFLEMVFGVEAGIDQFKTGIESLFSNADYIPASDTQIASGMVRKDLADNGAKLPEWLGGSSLGQVAYDSITTTANMLPSIMVSFVPVVGQAAGAVTLGASAAGNAKAEMLNLGYSKGQANLYGAMVGASEAGLQYLLGGIAKFGGKASQGLTNLAVSKVDNAIARVAITLGMNMASEGFEESLQTVIEPWLKSLVTGVDFEAPDIDEVLYSGLLGAVSSLVMEGGTTIYGEATRKGRIASEIYGENASDLVTEALELNPDNAFAQKMKALLDEGKTLSGGQLNRLVESNQQARKAEDTTKMKTAVEARLTELGESGDIGKLADVIVKARSGEKLSSAERDVLVNSKYGRRVSTEMNPDSIASGEYTSAWAEKIGTELINEEAYNKGLQELAEEVAGVEKPQPLADKMRAVPKLGNEPEKEIAVESKFEASTDGKTRIGDTEVSIKEIASVKGGEMLLRLEDGSTVNANDVEFGSSDEALLYENVLDMGMNAVTANAFIKGFDPSEGLTAGQYALGFREAYRYGEYGFPSNQMTGKGFSSVMSEARRSLAYDLGKTDAKYKISSWENAISSVKAGNKGKRKGKLHYEEGILAKGLTERQNVSLKGLKTIAEALGVDIYLYESKVGKNGKRKGANGWYDPKDGSIHIDIHAGLNGEGTILFTASHELVHFIRQWSPAKFKVLADFLLEKYGEKGVSVDALVRNQIDKAKRNGRDIDFDTAYEEVIADSCEAMLADGDVIQALAELKAKDESLWEKIKSFIHDLVAKIKAVYEGVEPDSVEGRYVSEMLGAATNLKTLFTDALVDAGENYQSIREALGEGSVIEVNEKGEFVVGKSKYGTTLFNDRTYDDGGRDILRATLEAEGYSDADIEAALAVLDEKHRLVKAFGEKYTQQDIVNKATLTTDLKNGKAVLSAIVSNGDYPVNIDLSMVCKKRVAYQNVINSLCKSGLIRRATIDSLAIAEINKVLGKYGFETACLGCFVESRRIRIQEWAETICKEWNGIVDKMVGKGNAKTFGFAEDTFVKDLSNDEVNALSEELDSAYERDGLNYGRTTVVKKMEQLLREVPSLRKHLSVADLITPTGRTNIKSLSSELNSLIACRYGSNTPKIVQNFNPYNHELAQYGKVPKGYDSLRDYLYAIGGARMQSFSDFIVENWFDYCQIVADLSARKLPMHTYTKEISLAKLFGMTGIKVNMSLIPDIDRSLPKEYAGLTKNANGEYELIFADKDRYKATGGKSYMQSISFADAVALQNDPRYSSNVGTIAVGISDNHIRMMLGDPRIRMVIPYHSSGMNPIFAHLVGTDYYNDYTNVQNTGVAYLLDSKGNKKSLSLTKDQKAKLTSGFEFNAMLQELGDARATAQAYLDWCADASKHTITINGETYTAVLTPKFDQFSDHENYYKLLEDFNTYDSITEQAAPQGDVQQIYPEDFDSILEDEIRSRENYRKKQEPKWESAMGEIESYLETHTKADTVAYADEHGIKLSKKDRAGAKKKLSDRDSLDNYWDSSYNLYTTTDDFVREVPYGDRHAFARSLANKTSGMTEGEIRTVYIYAGKIYAFRADGYMHGEMITSFNVNNKQMLEDIANEYDRIDQSTENASLWAETIQSDEGRHNSDSSIHGRGRSGSSNTLYEDPLERYTSRYTERERQTFETKEEIDEIVKKLCELYGLDTKTYSDGDSSRSAIEFSDVDIKYSIREEAPPKNTMEGYKVFVVKNGKLYPPMVANPNAEDTPVGVWLNADVGARAADSKTGRAQVKAGGKGTQGGSGSLAFRPGWHLGETPLATQFDRLNPETGVKELFPENFVWALCDIAADHDYQEEAMSYGYTKNGKFQHSLAGLPKLPTDGYYKYRTNPNPDTVPWLITGAMKVKKLLSDAEVNAILAEKGLPTKQRVGGEKTLADLGLSQYDGKLYSDRDPDSFSNRSLLANALESVAQNDIERNKLVEYKNKIALIESEQAKLAEVKAQANEIRFTKGRTADETKRMKDLEFEANQIANRINTYDRQLLNLESTKALKGVLEREKKMAYKKAEQKGKEALAKQREKDAKTQRELLTRYQESRKKGIEGRHKTEMRYKIKGVVNELNQYLKNTKEKHVPIQLQKPVALALAAVNMDTVGAEERIAKKQAQMRSAKSLEEMQKISKEIEHIQEMGGNMEEKLSRLKTAYDSIINSDDPLIANSHDEVISSTIDKVIEIVGETPIRDMSLYQLEAVYDMYRMVLTSIRKANKAFKAAKGEEISTMANGVIAELDAMKRKAPYSAKALQTLNAFTWNNLKPVYAFERIGSANFTKVFKAVRAGEDVWAKDMSEAKVFLEEQYKKHKYDSFDFEKKYSFESKSGDKFELDLGEIMSLYAYAKDEHSKGHLTGDGFAFDPKKEVVEKTKTGIKVTYNVEDATSYNMSEETLAEIIGKLTPEQKAFVDVMQEYLSATMGEKGNEVSLELYGIKLFKNKNYFPLKVSHAYMAAAKEKAQGDVKIKNKGFTKDRKEGAKNTVVLTSFMDVWASHVNEMSMYHAFTLPLEDFYRVFNYRAPGVGDIATISVNSSLINAHGNGAVQYIDQLLKDLNGGVRVDSTTGLINKGLSLFKKASVFASLSVVIQQPSAIARATALVDAKHFVGKKVEKSKHKAMWEEIKKYAPVAVIKDMGYFDTGMGKSSVDWLKGQKTFRDKVDDVLSKAPALADEVTWVAIWNAVKRETLHTHKNLRPGSEEFLQAVGERFTEVITKTQVYDSVLARSANMRSKDTGMKMVTAFMAEPTTSINMLGDALRKGKVSKKQMLRTMGAVYSSVVINSALVSIVYAMRDDDEDETYLEKYLSRFTTELVDGINPLTAIPLVKDIWSIAQGFDVERADMSLVTRLFDSLQQVVKVATKDTSDMNEDELSEYKKALTEAILANVDNISALFGIPVKNIRRDINGVINFIETVARGDKTTAGSLGDIMGGDLKDSVPVWGWSPDEKKSDKLYDAIVKGDTEYVDRLKGGYKSDSAYQSAIRKALKDNDPRIKEAAEAIVGRNFDSYEDILKEIVGEGNFAKADVKAAIDSVVSDMTPKEEKAQTASKEESIYEVEYVYSDILDGDIVMAQAMREDIIRTHMANGKERTEAEASFNNSFTSHVKKHFDEGDITDYEAREMLVGFAGKTEEKATSKVQYWEFQAEYPDYELTESAVGAYYEHAAPVGIGVGAYCDYYKGKSKCEGVDSNGDGRADSGTVKSQVLAVIHSLPLTASQKDALYFAEGWSASTLWQAPWH